MHNQNNKLQGSAGGFVWLSAPHLVLWECSLHSKHLVLIQHRHIEALVGHGLPLAPPQIPLGAAERDVVAIIQCLTDAYAQQVIVTTATSLPMAYLIGVQGQRMRSLRD